MKTVNKIFIHDQREMAAIELWIIIMDGMEKDLYKKYIVLAVPNIKERNQQLESVNWYFNNKELLKKAIKK